MNPDYEDYWQQILALPENAFILFACARHDLLHNQFLDDFLTETQQDFPSMKTAYNRNPSGNGSILNRDFAVFSYERQQSYQLLRSLQPHLAIVQPPDQHAPGYLRFIAMLESRMRHGRKIVYLPQIDTQQPA